MKCIIDLYFDKDGTLLPKSEDFKHLGYQTAFKQYGFLLNPKELEQFEGTDGSASRQYLKTKLAQQLIEMSAPERQRHPLLLQKLQHFGIHKTSDTTEEFYQSLLEDMRVVRATYMKKALSEKQIELHPAFHTFIHKSETLRSNGRLRLSLVTSDSRELVSHFLKVYSLEDLFHSVVTINDVPKGCGKPSPYPYEFTYKRLPATTLTRKHYFFEDTDTGVSSVCIMIRNCALEHSSRLFILPSKATTYPEKIYPEVQAVRLSDLSEALALIS
jgi:beta-phosphoglucomutase-like phosphatase (HAD superfamily)